MVNHQAVEANGSPLVLKTISIQNLRCLREVAEVPIQQGMTVVAGQNAGGKTTFLNALSFLLNGSQIPDDADRTHNFLDNEDIIVEGVFEQAQTAQEPTIYKFRARRSLGGIRQLEIAERMHVELTKSLDSMTVPELRDAAERLEVSRPPATLKADWQNAIEQFLVSAPPEQFVTKWRPATTAEANALPKVQLFDGSSAKGPIQLLQEIVRSHSQQLIAQEHHVTSLSQLQDELNAELQQNLTSLQNRVLNHCPELHGLFIDAKYDFARQPPTVGVRFGTEDQQVSIDRGGLGRNRRVALAIYEANLEEIVQQPDRSLIVAYDEPDTHLDHVAQRKLSRILETQAQVPNVQVIVATHSKNFVDVVPLSSVLCFQVSNPEFAKVSTLSVPEYAEELNFQSDIYQSLGFRNSTLIDEKCFLLVEGQSEINAMPLLYELACGRSLVADGIHLLCTNGSGAMKQFASVLRRDWNKSLIALLDSDQKDKAHVFTSQMMLVEDRDLFFLGTQEMEDAFPDDFWVDLLNNRYLMDDDEDLWIEEHIALWRTKPKFSRSLEESLRKKARQRSIGKPDIGLEIGKWCLSNELALPPDLNAALLSVRDAARSVWSYDREA